MTTYQNTNDFEVISYLVYINGVEIPAMSVSVSFGVWAVPSASISIPADRSLRGIGKEDRVRATVFYLDTVYYGQPTWCLLFDGEIASVSYSNQAGSRSLTLTCTGLLDGLQTLRTYYLMNISNLVTKSLNDAETNTPVGAHYTQIFPASLFFKGLNPAAEEPVRRPYDFIENIFRALVGAEDAPPEVLEAVKAGGSDVGPKDIKSVVALQWFARWARRTGFLNTWAPMQGFEEYFDGTTAALSGVKADNVFPVLQAVQQANAIDALRHVASRVGDGATLWDTVRQIFLSVYYEIGVIPCPPCVQATSTGEVLGPALGSKADRILWHITKPQMLFGLAPACNVLWKGTLMGHSNHIDYRNQPTRQLISDGNLFNIYLDNSDSPDIQNLINKVMAAAFPVAAQRALDARLGRGSAAEDPTINPHNFLVWPEEFYKGPVPSKETPPAFFVYLEQSKFSGAIADTTAAIVAIRNSISNHLKTIEKEGPTSEKWSTIFNANNVTLFDFSTFYDKIENDERSPVELTAEYDDVDKLKALWRANLQTSLSFGLSSDAVVTLGQQLENTQPEEESNLETYKLFAAYEYFRKRFSRSNGSVNSVFNPYVVPGFPGFVFDNDDMQQNQMMYVVNVTHSLSANSSSTNVAYSFASSPNEFFSELLKLRHPTATGYVDTRADTNRVEIDISSENDAEILGLRQRTIFIDPSLVDSVLIGDSGVISELAYNYAQIATEALDAAPANPVESYRVAFQRLSNARASYKKMFWRNQSRGANHDYVFDWREVLRVVPAGQSQAHEIRLGASSKQNFRNPNTSFLPSKKYISYNESARKGLQYNARPVCTLDEWIAAQENGVKKLPVPAVSIDKQGSRKAKGAAYYGQVLSFKEGVGSNPRTDRYGNILDPINIPDTRYPWTGVLLALRRKLYEIDYPNDT